MLLEGLRLLHTIGKEGHKSDRCDESSGKHGESRLQNQEKVNECGGGNE